MQKCRQRRPASMRPNEDQQRVAEHHPLSGRLYLYPCQTSHVLSSVHSGKTSHVLSPDNFQKTTICLLRQNILLSVRFRKISSYRTVSRKTSHNTTESPKKPEIFISISWHKPSKNKTKTKSTVTYRASPCSWPLSIVCNRE